jgi:hypothetical protein
MRLSFESAAFNIDVDTEFSDSNASAEEDACDTVLNLPTHSEQSPYVLAKLLCLANTFKYHE